MRLICIYANPRSGSSLTAKIFKAHGVWTEQPKNNVRGYPTYEWDELKWLIRGNCKWSDNCCFYDVPEFVYQRIDGLISERQENYVLFKAAPDYHQFLYKYDPLIVTVYRDFESTLKSQINGEAWDDDKTNKWSSVIVKRNQLMAEMDAPVVNVYEVLSGDFGSIKNAIEHCGLVFNEDIAASCIDQSLWHHR